MALIKCPECGRAVSDQAVSCPSCGLSLESKSWMTRKSILANISWYIFVTELVLFGLYIFSVFSDTDKDISRARFVLSIMWPSFAVILRIVSFFGLLFAVASLAKKEPKKVLGWICVVLHGAGLTG